MALWSSISYVSKELYKGHQVCVTAIRKLEPRPPSSCYQRLTSQELDYSVPTRRRRFIALAIFAVLGLGSTLGAIEAVLFRSEKSRAAFDILSFPGQAVCQRRPLHFSPPHASSGRRRYRHFDNVLLVVFFSHARYDSNLDFYSEVYAEYFPNVRPVLVLPDALFGGIFSSALVVAVLQILFVGPGSREDLGFDHSYDVLVDTYQAEEDLSDPDNYQMGGRMAHHMLYSAMLEHPCYDGYLWAPFDALLNIPRLQLFDQSKFWYHSPFGRYVPNPALRDIGNADHHAPPANISPDPAQMTAPWKGWSEDWWYATPLTLLPSYPSHLPCDFLNFSYIQQVGVRNRSLLSLPSAP